MTGIMSQLSPLQAEQIKEIGTYLRQKREESLPEHRRYRRPDDD
jgi:hypothetical protein